MQYTFKKTDQGIQGKAFEMAIKKALNRPRPDEVSPSGLPDFRLNGRNYDVKQNGTVIRYNAASRYIKGSSRVIYASHVAYNVIDETDETISIEIDLGNTTMFILDRNDFVKFLLENGLAKKNKSRGTINIQTGYNYKKDAYHGLTGKKIEAWAYENELDDIDDIIGTIMAGL